jgi:voltage-gated potassium channel
MNEGIGKHAYRLLIAATITVIGIGTVFYHLVEHFTWFDAYYFSVVTLATVGYGDLTPHTTLGRLFTTFYIFIGVGIVAAFISYTLRRRVQIRAGKRNHRKR